MIVKLLRVSSICFLIATLLAVLTISVKGLHLFHSIKKNPAPLERFLTQKMEQPVHVGGVCAQWQGFKPVLVLNNFVVTSKNGEPLLNIRKIILGIDIISSLFKQHFVPGDLTIVGTHLVMHEKQPGIININDIPLLEANLNSADMEKLDMLLDCFLANGVKQLKDINIDYYDLNGRMFPIKQLNLSAKNNLLSHFYIANAQIDKELTPIHIEGNAYGSLLAKSFMYAKFKINLQKLPLQQNALLSRFIQKFEIKKGFADLKLNFIIKPNQKKEYTGFFIVKDILLQSNNNPSKVYSIPVLQSNLAFQSDHSGWAATLEKLQLKFNDSYLPLHQVHIEQVTNQQGFVIQNIKCDHIPIKEVRLFLTENDLLSSRLADIMNNTQPSGGITDFVFKSYGNDLSNLKNFSFNGDLQNVSFLPWQHYPGIQNLSGNLAVTPRGGSLKIHSTKTTLNYKPMFREDIPIEKLNAFVSWNKDAMQHWLLNINRFAVVTKEAKANGYIRILSPESKADTKIQTHVNFVFSDISQGFRYYPTTAIPATVIKWLDQAIKGGRLDAGHFILNGKLKDFPFDHNNGKFLITAKLHEGQLYYQRGWPEADHISGTLRFENRSMHIHATHATLLHAIAHSVDAKIADLDKALLTINGHLNTTGDEEIKCNAINNPLAQFTQNPTLQGMNIRGKLNLGLDLSIPLDKNILGGVTYTGKMFFNDVDIKSNLGQFAINNLKGDLAFTQDSAKSKMLQGFLYKKPFRVSMESSQNNDHSKTTQIKLTGRLSVSDFRDWTTTKILNYFEGSSDYTANLKVTTLPSGNTVSSGVFISNLSGIQSNLPAPFAKIKNANTPAYVQFETTNTHSLTMNIKYDNKINTALRFNHAAGGYNFERGLVHFGSQKADLPTTHGLDITGDLPAINIKTWQNLFTNKHQASNQLDKLRSFLHSVDVKIAELTLLTTTISSLQFKAYPTEQALQLFLNSPAILGEVSIPNTYPKGVVRVNLQSLVLPDKPTFKSTMKPSDIPAIDLSIANLYYKNKMVRNFQVKLRTQGNDLLIKQASISESLFQITASGVWRWASNRQETTLFGKFSSRNVGAALNQWKITDNVVRGEGYSNFKLSWFNTPFDPEVKTLSGQMDLHFNQGRISNLSSQANLGMGVGRVLTLFSLQTIPRRLKGDFSDLTESGFSFDEMKGSFQFKEGNVFTENANIDGTVAKVRILGRIGLDNKDYDLRLAIAPNVTSSLPVVATLTAGPIVGAITWLADKILSRQVKRMTEIHYNVTGSWDHPDVKNLTPLHHPQNGNKNL